VLEKARARVGRVKKRGSWRGIVAVDATLFARSARGMGTEIERNRESF
jgi:hypothetical protein